MAEEDTEERGGTFSDEPVVEIDEWSDEPERTQTEASRHETPARKTPTPGRVDETPKAKKSKTGIWIFISVVLAIALIAAIITGGFRGGDKEPTTGQAVGDGTVPGAGQAIPAPPGIDDDAVKGEENAPVTIIEFSDFQCPFCARFFEDTLPNIEGNYIEEGKVRLVYRDFPLNIHPGAQKAAEAAECAKDQGKFWEMHDKLFENSESLSLASLKQYAGKLGLDQGKFDECLDSGEKEEEVMKDFQDGSRSGVSGTPTFFINGQMIVGAQPYEVFEQAIEAALAA